MARKKIRLTLLHFPYFDHSMMQDANSLLLRIRAGDDRAIEEVYLLCRQGFCQNFAYKWNLSTDQVLELYQESFLVLLESIQIGKIQEVRQGWLPLLKGIGRNLLLVQNRQTKQLKFESEELLPNTAAENEANDEEAFLQIIQAELDNLGEKCRELIDLRVLKDLSYKAIYSWLNPSQNTQDESALATAIGGIRVQYGRCIDRLREKVFDRVKNTGLWN